MVEQLRQRAQQAAASARRMLFEARAATLPRSPWLATWVATRELAIFWLPVLLPAAVVLAVSWLLDWILPVVLAGSVLLLWASFVIHELGHVVALRLLAARAAYAVGVTVPGSATLPAVFAVDGVGAGVHRPRLHARWRESIVILAGPLLPVVVWAAGVAMFSALGLLIPALVVWTGIVAWGHPVALLFPVGDGRALYRVWRPA